MSIKDLFGKTSQKILSGQQLQELYDEAESAGYLEELSTENQRFLPTVDFSSASNFARYGSAEKYYVDGLKNIYQRYPYDGSRKEKVEWRNNSSQFDLYLFDSIYPKTTGYVTLNSSSQQYVSVFGGPNTASSGKFGDANLYDAATNRKSNLGINPLNLGNTVEFWFKETGVNANIFPVFDLWNGQASGSSNYSRFLIERSGSSHFRLTYCSGTAGVVTAVLSASLDVGNWHHYAFSINSASAGLNIRQYIDSVLVNNLTTGSAFDGSANNLKAVAYIGAYRSGSAGYLNASFDEFRFWKESRTSKNIGRYWFTSVGGGANTDDSNTELGVYFKFNEGVISTTSLNSLDAQCLDYSGRISNGTIVNYTTNVRSTGSAIDLYSENFSEIPDPILYPTNPRVASTIEAYQNSGSVYDNNNNVSIYKSLPTWITEEQEEKSGEDLQNLVQIISSYFDTLHLQIENLTKLKEARYYTDSDKPPPFLDKILTSYGFENIDIFNDTTFLEDVLSRNETDEFERKLPEIKNIIYQNIFNNLTYIYKSKGTEKSLRNLIRCFGVDDELIKINIYADNTEYTIKNKYQYVTIPKKYINFNNADRYEGTIFQKSFTGDSDTRGYIKGNSSGKLNFIPITLQSEVIFPKKVDKDNINYDIPEFTNISLFGIHTADDDESVLSWGNDEFNFNVSAVKRDFESSDVYFKISGSLSSSHFQLTSSWFTDVYEDSKWNLAVRIKPQKYDNSNFISGSEETDYLLEFVGFNSLLDSVENSFSLSTNITKANAQTALSKNKRVFAGALYNNYNTSSIANLLASTDVKISSVRFWFDYLNDDELQTHSFDASNYGRQYPNWSAHLYANDASSLMLTKADMLALNWDFNQVTGSDANGEFLVEDASSGSVAASTSYGMDWLGDIIKYRHTAVGKEFYPNDEKVVSKEYVYSAKQQQPETLVFSDLVEIRDTDDLTYTKNSKPTSFYYSIEKSMSQVINDEILNWFATIEAFSNLFGEPIDRYSKTYKNLDHLRALFFEKVQNEPDFERFITFYKWIDSSISLMVRQLIPASSNVSEKVRNIVESHILERNKYENKLPTIEIKGDPTVSFTNTQGFNYQSNQAANNPTGSYWLKSRVERTSPLVSSGDAAVDADREVLRQAIYSKNLNQTQKLYDQETNTFYEGKKDIVRGYSNPVAISSSFMEVVEKSISPVNIKNSLVDSTFNFASETITGSGQILEKTIKQGNYFNNYEVVQTSGRTTNSSLHEIQDTIDTITSSNFVTDQKDRLLPTRATKKTVFVERFSAPGGAEVTSRGALEKSGEELSVYNGLNNRNFVVRSQLKKWLAETSSIDSQNPSLHKVNKNVGYRADHTGNIVARYDNEFIVHQIPRSDAQYAWITASLITKPAASGYFNKYDNLNVYNSASILFASASVSGSTIKDFVGLNTNIVKTIDTASNTLSVSTQSLNLNTYLLNINGGYRFPTWKQIRKESNKIVAESRKNNKILLQDEPTLRNVVINGVNTAIVDKRTNTFTSFKEPAVSFNLPMEMQVKTPGSTLPVELVASYDNNKEKLSNVDLSRLTNTNLRKEPQIYDVVNAIDNSYYEPKTPLEQTKYRQQIYPEKNKLTLADVRTRPNYEDYVGNTESIVNTKTFWRDASSERAREKTTVDLFEYTTSSYDSIEPIKYLTPYNKVFANNLLTLKHSGSYRDSIFAQDVQSSYLLTSSIEQERISLRFFGSIDLETGLVESYGLSSSVNAIYSSGSDLIVGGITANPISDTNSTLAKFNYTNKKWEKIGDATFVGSVGSIISASDGIYVGGNFTVSTLGFGYYSIVKWDNSSWSSIVDTTVLNPTEIFLHSASSGLYVAGNFTDVNGTASADYLTKWDGVDWYAIGGGGSAVFNNTVKAVFSSSDGLYAFGIVTY